MNEILKVDDPIRERVRKNFAFTECADCESGVRECADCVWMQEFENCVDITKRLLEKKNLTVEDELFLYKFFERG